MLIGLSIIHAVVLIGAPSIAVIAVGLWWNSNTISHSFIHLPFFRSSILNRVYSVYLTLLLGFPQSLWRDRHLAHHRGQAETVPLTNAIAAEILFVTVLWGVLLAAAPRFFLTMYLPGWAIGLGLCYLHGFFEHWQGGASHHGSAYNIAFFNDGYHVEHHAKPGVHWTQLGSCGQSQGKISRWPAILRWIEILNLETLERIATHSPALQRFMLATHRRAFSKLLSKLPYVGTVKIIGGGLFPRSALLVRSLLPESEITIVDANARNIETARTFLDDNFRFRNEFYQSTQIEDADLLVIPLAFVGDRAGVYRNPPAGAVLVHDWIWTKRGESVKISWLLLKRLNLIRR